MPSYSGRAPITLKKPGKEALPACPLDANIAAGGVHFQQRSASVQRSIRGQRLAPPIAFAADVNVGKIRCDLVPVAHVHTGTYVDRDVRSNINGNVTSRGFQIGVVTLAARVHDLHRNSSGAGFRSRGWDTVQFDPASTRFGM